MDFPALNGTLFAEDLFLYISERSRTQCNLPFNLSVHRLALKTYFKREIGEAIVHRNMINLVESYTVAYDFCYRQYFDTTQEEASKLLNGFFKYLAKKNYGLLKVCASAVEVYLLCIELENYERAYDTMCTFIFFLLKLNKAGGQKDLINIDLMAEIINRAHRRLDNM